ncbi:DUF3253 domain-containing protein [Streptomyces sp. enrichment culture]|uniref:DUF3253 domain-containing protein n=1 Tax=Streptomyces sp. enrichment culture TaxID=1795815 RepID=UPI003F5554E2
MADPEDREEARERGQDHGRDRDRDRRLEQVIIGLLDQRSATASICPSDAARTAYDGDDDGWRALMEPVRRAAWRLVSAGEVEVTQAGRPVAEESARGPLRIRRAGRR